MSPLYYLQVFFGRRWKSNLNSVEGAEQEMQAPVTQRSLTATVKVKGSKDAMVLTFTLCIPQLYSHEDVLCSQVSHRAMGNLRS